MYKTNSIHNTNDNKAVDWAVSSTLSPSHSIRWLGQQNIPFLLCQDHIILY
jgi:hypothetical protein